MLYEVTLVIHPLSLDDDGTHSRPEIEAIDRKYDWVINARRSLLHVKLDKPLAELRNVVHQLAEGHLVKLPQGPQREAGE